MESKSNRKKYLWILLLFLTTIAAVAGICSYAVKNITYSQYVERVENANILMEKIGNHIETAVEFNWERIHYIRNQIENEEFSSVSELLEMTAFCEQQVKEKASTKLLMVDADGFCYVSDGSIFKWMVPSLLNQEEDVMYVSDYQFASKIDMQMHYLTRLSKPFTVEGITFTHVSMACEMSELDSFFDVSNYGNESMTFIIHQDGSQVYYQKKQTALSGIYNLLSVLKEAEFNYGSSYQKIATDIQSEANDSVHVTLDGVNYFVSYHKINIKDWVVVLLVPGQYVGTGTRLFTLEIIRSVVLLFGSIVTVVILIFAASFYQINKKNVQVKEQLQKAAEAERAANEAKTNFLSSMSHDIRTPMNAIMGMVTIAMKRVEDKAYIKECLEKIRLASGHLLTLVNDILDISKVESGKMTLSPEAFSLSECFQNLINIMQPQIKEKNLDVRANVHIVQKNYLYADQLRLNQIFINILSNAIKYTNDRGTIWVDLYEEQIESNIDAVRIRYIVKDTGIGMSREYQETMYQSFSRVTDSRTSKIQGSGLGLAICKQMVELMGGTIECESELGVGTTFTVTMELALIDLSPEELVLHEQVFTEEQNMADLAGLRLLVAEDNDMNWEIAETILDMQGILAERAENGSRCIEMMQSAEPGYYAMVLMDVRMPVMDGREATRALRHSDKKWIKEIPVIAMTADAFAEDIQECLEAGMNDHISKPIDVSRLFRILKKYSK